MDAATRTPDLHGLLAEFRSAQALVDAAEKAHRAGFRAMDAYSPYPIEHLSEVICDHHKSRVPLICLVGGIVGALSGWALAVWTSAVDYPVNVGGRPMNSWPAFIPVIFECTILFAAFSAGLGMIALNGLPQPYHPVFNVEALPREGVAGRLLPLHRGRGPQVRPRHDPRVPDRGGRGGGDGS